MATPAGRTLKEWLPVILGGLAGTDPYLSGGIRTATGIHDRQTRNRLLKEQEAREREREKVEQLRERNIRAVIHRVLKGEEGAQAELLRASAEADPFGSLGPVMRYVEAERTGRQRGVASRMAALKERMAQRAKGGEEKTRAGAARMLGVGDVEGARRLLAESGMGTEAMRLGMPSEPKPPENPWVPLDRKRGMERNKITGAYRINEDLKSMSNVFDMSEILDLEDEYNDAMGDVREIEAERQVLEGEFQALSEKLYMMQSDSGMLRSDEQELKRKIAVLDAKLVTANKRAELAKMKILAAQEASDYRPDQIPPSPGSAKTTRSGEMQPSHDTTGGQQYIYDPNRGGLVPAG